MQLSKLNSQSPRGSVKQPSTRQRLLARYHKAMARKRGQGVVVGFGKALMRRTAPEAPSES